jgi:glycosyltransferase involved in cell wall biosynthesis
MTAASPHPTSHRPLHIALTTPAWPVGVPNGIVTYVHNIRLGLLALGHRVSVFSGSAPVGDNIGDARTMAERWDRGLLRRAGLRLGRAPNVHAMVSTMVADEVARVHARDPIDLLEMEETQGWFADIQRRLPMPVLPKLHGPAFLTEPGGVAEPGTRAWREGQALRQSRFVCAPATQTLQRTLEQYGLAAIEHAVLPNPVAPVDQPELRWQLSNAPRKTLLYVGRFEYIKGGDVVLQAFRAALAQDPELRLLYVGPNDKTVDIEGQPHTLAQAIERWFAPRERAAIEVLGPQPAAEVARLRCRARLALMCSRFENQPNVVLEAMSQGCPVVATDVGGVGEIVQHERNGMLAASQDATQLAQAMLRLVADDALAQRLSEAGRAWVHEHLRPEAAAERNVQWYRHVIERHHGA